MSLILMFLRVSTEHALARSAGMNICKVREAKLQVLYILITGSPYRSLYLIERDDELSTTSAVERQFSIACEKQHPPSESA